MKQVLDAVQKLIREPYLKNAIELKRLLASEPGVQEYIFSRRNQKAAVEANSNPMYAMKERVINAFEGTEAAAIRLLGLNPQSAAEAMLLFNPKPPVLNAANPVSTAEAWTVDSRLSNLEFTQPLLRIWDEPDPALAKRQQFAQKHVTVLMRDSGGMSLLTFRNGFLEINSDSKLDVPWTIGKYGWGASASFKFCDFVLALTRSRETPEDVYWTLIFNRESETQKQRFEVYWYGDAEGNPLRFAASDLDLDAARTAEVKDKEKDRATAWVGDNPDCRSSFGTHVFHIGYNGDGWTNPQHAGKEDAATRQFKESFASFSLPFSIQQEGSRRYRPSTGMLVRLETVLERLDPVTVPYNVRENNFGEVTVQVTVLPKKDVAKETHLSDLKKNVLYTQFGLTQGFGSFTLLNQAGYHHLSTGTRVLVEVKLDRVTALDSLVQPNRESLHPNEYTEALQETVVDVLKNMEAFKKLEQAESSNTNETVFVAGLWEPDEPGSATTVASTSEVEATKTKRPRPPRPKTGGERVAAEALPINDPPTFIQFVGTRRAVNLHPGKKTKVRFTTDADRKKFTFKNGLITVDFWNDDNKPVDGGQFNVQVTKTYLSQTGRGFVEVVYNGEPYFKRTTICEVTLSLEVMGDFILTDPRELFTKSKSALSRETKAKKGAYPKVAPKYFVEDVKVFEAEFPQGLPEWGILPGQVKSFDDGATKLNDPAWFTEDLNLPRGERPPMSYADNGVVMLEIDLLKVITDLNTRKRGAVSNGLLFTKYLQAVARKASYDCLPNLSVFSLASTKLTEAGADLSEGDTLKQIKRALKNHSDAVQQAVDLEKTHSQAAGL